jgi:hypothetical protein
LRRAIPDELFQGKSRISLEEVQILRKYLRNILSIAIKDWWFKSKQQSDLPFVTADEVPLGIIRNI